MSFITREDGEHFVIPSYRDVLGIKKSTLLKDEILALSQNYGSYITLQKKNVRQFEVAFSQDPGYLLGETVWHFFKRPADLLFCEVIPNTNQAILVVVKSGSVYLDGTFSVDSIQDELVVFLTQKIDFDIYISGDVPISRTPEDGKFSFEANRIKSFTVLPEPIFQKLPKIRAFQLQLVDSVLRRYGIGVFPVRKVVMGVVAVGLLWMSWSYLTTHKKVLPTVLVRVINPYEVYVRDLTSPSPYSEMNKLTSVITELFTIPGWTVDSMDYGDGKLKVAVRSLGVNTDLLTQWAAAHQYEMTVDSTGFFLSKKLTFINRQPPQSIIRLDNVIANLVDRLSAVIPGNHLSLTDIANKGQYRVTTVTVSFTDMTPMTFNLIGLRLNNLPLVLNKVQVKVSHGDLNGKIVIVVLGS